MHNYLTAGTDEVSMGMVKRVLYTATGGSCRDPEAVSWSRNKSGGTHNAETSSPNRGMTFKTYCVLNHTKRNSPTVQLISLFSLGVRFHQDVSAIMLTFIKKCLMSQLPCSISMLMAARVS